MRRILHLLFCLLPASGAFAQTQPMTYRHAVGVGFERVGLDGPDATGDRYLVKYDRYLRNDRIIIVANLGYMSVRNRVYLPGSVDYYVEGERRQRVTADLTAAFDFIKHSQHALRLGAGPSLWYRQEELFNGVRYTLLSNGSVTNVRADWRAEKAFDFGFNVLIEYEYAFAEQFLLSGKVKFIDLGKGGGQSAIYGAGIGYRLR